MLIRFSDTSNLNKKYTEKKSSVPTGWSEQNEAQFDGIAAGLIEKLLHQIPLWQCQHPQGIIGGLPVELLLFLNNKIRYQ